MGTYSYTGKVQKVTVENTGTFAITAYGGAGGTYSGPSTGTNLGGSGAEIGGNFNLVAGERLKIIVGGAGGTVYRSGGGGGGGTFVLASTNGGATYTPLLVAGGGGGGGSGDFDGGGGAASYSNSSINSSTGGAGGSYKKDVAGTGGGGAGVKASGTNGTTGFFGQYGHGGSAGPNYSGGIGGRNGSEGGNGGFGGGGGGGSGYGAGGGGYSGGGGGTEIKVAGGGTSFDSAGAPILARDALAAGQNGNGLVIITPNAVCYVSGTLIRTDRGNVAVEHLTVGDRAVTASSAHRPIRWLGHRRIDCRLDPQATGPVRISAHAFGLGLPARDLFLSPGHPVLVGADDGEGGHLVPIMCLINGTTIERVAVEEVTYWHVELDEHDILLAEGLPAESYIDLGSRPWFAGADGALYDPDFALPGMPDRCRPVAIDGPIVEAERRRLDMVFATRLTGACAWPNAEASLSLG